MLKINSINNRRRIVVHHTHLLGDTILKHLSKNDIVFFDDCLYSQYVFIKKHHKFFSENQIDCVIGFSSGLYADENAEQIYAVNSADLHNACNKCISTISDANRLRNSLLQMNGFMTIPQLKELLSNSNINLALHGCCHLKLCDELGILNKMCIFKRDVDDGIKQLRMFGLSTDIFVYPYVQSFYSSDALLRKHGFKLIIGSTIFRYAIEDLAAKQVDAKCNC